MDTIAFDRFNKPSSLLFNYVLMAALNIFWTTTLHFQDIVQTLVILTQDGFMGQRDTAAVCVRQMQGL